ncbi:efflux RND transporter periplasmic adaptor subunit [Pseudoduganella violacea]|uniref:RND family efflux transporter MFP subunit n=1 Tax=Pseudoduganella violacea TaxID=1715466 RepID=A0A7W5BC40_9BURK|nr:efflux RND transporter periplasmic adaptor subunit [Pseudoduganella violacea]MBB3120447.1 RND family efflux transporter MFP subunit [Pseudoduganella violacea]
MTFETLPLKQSRMPRWRKPVIALVLLGVVGGGWTVLHHAKDDAAPASAAHDEGKDGKKDKIEVYELAGSDVAAVEARALAVSLPLSGSLVPVSQATIKAKVSGQVHESAPREGMAVSAGQVLTRIDQADPQARLKQQQAQLDEAQARLALAQKNEGNSQALLRQQYISQNSYDSTANAVELARANVKAAAAQVELARIALNDSTIRAPFSGIISKRHVQAGEKVAPDMPVYTIVNLAELVLEAQVPSTEIPRVKVGQDVQFQVDGFQRRPFHGKVARINPTTEAGSRAMLVYVSVANADGALRGGMFAKGSIVTEKSAVMPLVPLAALRKHEGKDVVFKVEQNKVVAQPVAIGLRSEDEGYAEVTGGLEQGSQVIVAKLENVKPGDKVKLPAAPAGGATPNKAAMLAKQD